MSRRHAREPAPSSSPRRLVALLSGPESGEAIGSSRGGWPVQDAFSDELADRMEGETPPAVGRPGPDTARASEGDWVVEDGTGGVGIGTGRRPDRGPVRSDRAPRPQAAYYASAYAARDLAAQPWPQRDHTDFCDDGDEDEDLATGTDPFRAPGRGRRAAPSPHRPAGPAVLELPEALAGARVRPRGLALLGMLLVVLLAAGVFAGRVWWAERAAVPQPIGDVAATGEASSGGTTGVKSNATRAGSPGPGRSSGAGTGEAAGVARPGTATRATAAADAGAGSSSGAGSGAPGGQVVAHVVGEVRKPGVVTLPTASRVADAIARVGGLSPKADPTSINLARPLVDGEQIVVLARGAAPATGLSGVQGAAGSAVPSAGAGGAPVDLNTADLAALDELPGVGPVMAGRIIAWRTEHGRFSSVDELGEVSGVGEKTLERLRPLVRV